MMEIKDFLQLIDIDESKLIKATKEGYLLPFSSTPVMFLSNEQRKEFDEQQIAIALHNEYNYHIRREGEINKSDLYQIRNMYDGANLGFGQVIPCPDYTKAKTFSTYKEALNYMIENDLLMQCNRIYPVKFVTKTIVDLEVV